MLNPAPLTVLVADSVVKEPAAGVVLPIAGGDAKLAAAALITPAAMVTVVPSILTPPRMVVEAVGSV